MPEIIAASAGQRRDFVVVSTAQFSMAFALNFVLVFLPFYIQTISPLGDAATLRWTGLIVGAAPAMAAFGSTFWGGLTDRFSPKTLFERGMLSHLSQSNLPTLYLVLGAGLALAAAGNSLGTPGERSVEAGC